MKNMEKISFVTQLCIYMWCIVGILNAQPQTIRFKYLTIDNGLSQSWVHSICQDKYGFIWIGTDDGLNRYDGYNFHIYKNVTQNEYSISSSSILTMFEDSRGNLWIGTREGLNLYDRKNDRFIRHSSITEQAVRSIAEDKDKNLWIGAAINLFRLNLENDSLYTYATDTVQNSNSLSNNDVRAIFIDDRNNIWIGTAYGLNLYDKATNSFLKYYHNNNDPGSLGYNDIRSLLVDKSGRLWIGTPTGLGLFTNAHDRPLHGKFEHYQNNSKDQNSISQGAILSLFEDDQHNLWIGTENGGLDLFNLNAYKKGENSFAHFKNDPNSSTSLSNNSIYSLFQDKQSNIWIGTFGNGINIISAVRNKFIHFLSEPGNKNSLINNQVNTILEDKNFLWIGTEGGLERYNKIEGTFKHFVHDPFDRKSIGSNAVWALCKDKRGNLWVGTWAGGLNRFDYKTETFEHYYNNPQDTNSISANNIFSIFEDSKGNLWIGTMGGGLNLFDRQMKKFTRYNNANSGLYTNFVASIVEAKNGDLWLGNEASLERFNLKTKEIDHFLHSADDSNSISSNYIISILEDSKGNIWVGTNAGLNLFNKSTEGFICYRMENGLPDNSINSILEDYHGNLWLGTNRGLVKFIDAIKIPAKPKFKNYTFEDGLQSNGFGKRSCSRSTDGMMYFGGTNGFNIFDPDKVTDNTYIPPIVINEFQIFNKPVSIGGRGLQNENGEDESLVLSYQQSVISFGFSALNYNSSSKNQYAYMMEGFDEEWNYVGTKRSATYTNLDPGEYVFKVKGSNNDGVWNEQGASIHIIITPPFWQSLWFKLIILIIVISIAIFIYRRFVRARKLAEEHRIEQALAKERNLLRMVIDNLPDGIFVKDLKSRKTLANRADVYNTGNKSEDEVLGKDDFELFPKEMAEGFIADDQEVMQTGKPVFNREEYVIDANGQKHYLLTTKLPFRNEQDQIIGLIGIGRDITQRKLAEEALSQKTALLEAQLNSSIDGILVVDNQGKKILQNQRTVELWKIPKEIADNPNDQMQVNHVMHSTKDPDQFVSKVKYLYDHLNENSRDEIELKDGTILERYSAPVIGNDGRNHGRIWTFHDITEKKLAEETLKGERNLLRTLIDNMPDYVYVKDTGGRFIVGNAATARQLGFASEVELLGKTDFDIFPRELAEKYNSDEQKILHSGKGLYEFEGPTIDPNKEHKDRWISTTKVPFLDAQGKIVGTVGIGRDITERKRIEEEREILITELQNALADVKVLKGLVPICSNCKKIRDDSGFWNQLESYIQKHSQAKFSHGICPDCMGLLYPDIQVKLDKGKDDKN